jgi:hypothetical protein
LLHDGCKELTVQLMVHERNRPIISFPVLQVLPDASAGYVDVAINPASRKRALGETAPTTAPTGIGGLDPAVLIQQAQEYLDSIGPPAKRSAGSSWMESMNSGVGDSQHIKEPVCLLAWVKFQFADSAL